VFIDPTPGRQVAIYYSQDNGSEDILLYGVAPYGSGGVISLPRYVLGYYLILAIIATVVLAVLLLIVRKKPVVRLWIERVLLFPVSYVISHMCVMCAKGVLAATYSAQREFLFIMLIAVLIYLAGLFGINVFRASKESRDV
jgi:hydrogenase/urease accessory protein HupE